MRWLALVLLVGCVHPTQRTGTSLSLGDRAPTTECDQKAWLELAPAHSKSLEATVADGHREADGMALFDAAQRARDLRKLVPQMDEPLLQIPLRTYVEPVRRRNLEATYWLLGGLAAMSAGAAYAATGGEHLAPGHVTALSAGLTLGLTGALITIIRMPKKRMRMEADLRRTMFVDGEYDLEAVKRGTLRMRERQRAHCLTTQTTR